MFKRRNPQPLYLRIKDLIWPARGFHRSSQYIAHRLRRLPGTPHRIAAGFASGAALSFTPFVGFHFAFAALICLPMRGNILAAALGTAVGNPATFPFIWAWLYTSGHWMLGRSVTEPLNIQFDLDFVITHFWDVFWPMTLAGIPTASLAWFAFFFPVRRAVREYQRARRWRIRRKVKKRHDQVTAKRGAEFAEGLVTRESRVEGRRQP
ncbi:MAG: DUF2062 domain-containing protein [Kiloniellales bacterium]|nr:DUF2062 domain-containing protein [Kiloniellales bacterium]